MDFVAKNQKIAKRASHIQRGRLRLPPLPSLSCVHAAALARAHPHHKYISWAWQQRNT